MWIGYTSPAEFNTPDGMTKKMNGLTRWFTNLDIQKRHEKLILWQRYYDDNGNPLPDVDERYPKYDNYAARNVDKVADIPMDYKGVMGVPITFMDKYNPDEFEIVGMDLNTMVDELGIREIGNRWITSYANYGTSSSVIVATIATILVSYFLLYLACTTVKGQTTTIFDTNFSKAIAITISDIIKYTKDEKDKIEQDEIKAMICTNMANLQNR